METNKPYCLNTKKEAVVKQAIIQKVGELTAEQEDYMLESQLELMRERKEVEF